MKVYTDASNQNINIVQSVASASTMISSVTQEAKHYIISKFPNDFFKHIYIDTSETVTQQNYNDKYNKNANKIPYPSMTITPEISLDDPIGGMQKTLHLSSPNLYLRRDTNRAYKKLVVDPEYSFGMYYTLDYITTNFNFKIVTNSFIQNTDLAFFLQSNFQRGFFQYLNKCYIQSEIPKTFIRTIADLKNWDLEDSEQMDELRLYLIQTSKQNQTIQKRINLSTGKQCFFINEQENLLVLFDDLDCPPSINRDSQVEGEYTITFRLQVSCWVPNSFILTINKETLKKLSPDTINTFDCGENPEFGFYSKHIYAHDQLKQTLDTISFFDSSEQECIGHILFADSFTHDANENTVVIPIMSRMSKEFQKIYSYAYNILNLDMSSLLKCNVYLNSLRPLDDKLININYENLSLSVNSGGNDIFLRVYINRALYDSIREAYKTDKNYFSSNYMTSINTSIYGENKKVIVKYFEKPSDMHSNDNPLRIMTPYGIGYISLLNNSNKNGYKICLGNDENGMPIIKQFEFDEH